MVAAQGEMDASKSLREAAETIAQSSSALQLRYAAYRIPLHIFCGFCRNHAILLEGSCVFFVR